MKKKNLGIWIGIMWLMAATVFAGCTAPVEVKPDEVSPKEVQSEDAPVQVISVETPEQAISEAAADTVVENKSEKLPENTSVGEIPDEIIPDEIVSVEAVSDEVIPDEKTPDGEVSDEEVLGDPRSSYGLGSAAYLKGRNVLVSLFVTTPESSFNEEEQLQMLRKIEKAVAYIERQAEGYDVPVEILYDFTEYPDLKKEAETDLFINETVDFVDRLDEEIALWQEELLCYEDVKEHYGAEGIATMIFVNNPGISYAIVYDGTDSKKETMILFAEDYYRPGKEESETAYAHEILHVFGAHDLYEDAEFTAEVTDYVALTYPKEIMYTVTQTGEQIEGVISPVTAYHLGWIESAEEIGRFPQLMRE